MYSDKATVAEPTQQKTPTTQPKSTKCLHGESFLNDCGRGLFILGPSRAQVLPI